MKVKTTRFKGCTRLLVDDAEINKRYDATQKKPLEIASMTNFYDASVYCVQDWRLTKSRPLSPYLSGQDSCFFEPKDKESEMYLRSKLHTFKEKEGKFSWCNFDTVCFEGDNPDSMSKHGNHINVVARFTYQGAKEKFLEIKEFWENWHEPDLMLALMHNPYRQITDSQMLTWEIMRDMCAEDGEAFERDFLDKHLTPNITQKKHKMK